MRITFPCKIESAGKALAYSFLLFSALALPVCAQDNSTSVQMRQKQEEMQRKAYEMDLAKWRPLLQEYRQGRRDDHDGVAILFNILNDFGALHSTGTAEDIALTKEYQQLLNKYPDYRINLPIKTHDQIAAKASAEKKAVDVTKSSSTYVPTDATPISYYQHGNNAAVVYQYRIELLHLKPGETLTFALIRGESKIAELPYRVMTFQQVIRTEPGNYDSYKGSFFLVCTDPADQYLARNDQERKLMGQRGILWRNQKGKLHDFCGVVSIDDGNAIPIKTEWNTPIFTRPLGMLQNGTECLLGVGRLTNSTAGDRAEDDESGDGAEVPHFAYRYLLRWIYPNEIQKIDINKLSDEEFDDLTNKFRASLPNRQQSPSYYENP